MTNLTFGAALENAKLGHKVARTGWNGRGMWIVVQRGYPTGIPINDNTASATGFPVGTVCKFHPYLMMKDVSGAFFPWNPNQLDLLSEDWEIVPF